MSKTKEIQDQINEWKEKYGDIYALPVDDKTGYLRSPDMVDYKRAFTAMQKGGDVAFGEEMLKALWLGGDEEILNDDDYFLPARKEMLSFFNYPDAEIISTKNNHQIIIGEAQCVIRTITRNDLKLAEKKNPGNKPFITQEKLFEIVCLEKDEAFNNKKNAEIRFPLFQAIEQLQNKKTALLKKL